MNLGPGLDANLGLNVGASGIERAPSLTEQVAKHIAAAIDDGSFRPGERLVESRLAEFFGVSRGPVREALKALETENVVTISPGRGTFVTAPSAEDIELMIPAWALLEGLAARWAVAAADKDTISRLNLLCRRLRDAADRRETASCLALYWGLHDQLCHRSGNPSVVRSWQAMRSQLRLFWRAGTGGGAEIDRLARETGVLSDGLNGRDAEAADAIFRSHILEAGYRILSKPIPAWLESYVARPAMPEQRLHERRGVAALSAANGESADGGGTQRLSG